MCLITREGTTEKGTREGTRKGKREGTREETREETSEGNKDLLVRLITGNVITQASNNKFITPFDIIIFHQTSY